MEKIRYIGNVRRYRSTVEEKEDFVNEVLSNLMIQADTGYFGATYEHTEHGEYVHLFNREGCCVRNINVTADSLESLIRDVFKNL